MKIYTQAVLYWFVLLVAALLNAIIRETTYKPFLTPHIGKWAHQISSLTGILLFFIAIYFFVKKNGNINKKTLTYIGLLWIIMTLLFESGMNMGIRKLTPQQVLETYYFWNGETWLFVLLSLGVSPIFAHSIIHSKK